MNPIILVILPVVQENTEAQERECAEHQRAKDLSRRLGVALGFGPADLALIEGSLDLPPKREPDLDAQTTPQASSSTTQHADASWQDVSEKLTQAVTALRQLVRQSLR